TPRIAPAQLVRMLYCAHLGLMLLWTQDRSPDSDSTVAAIDLVCEMLSMSGPMMWVPGVKSTLGKMDQICSSLIEPESDSVESKLSVNILRRLFAHRRLLPDASECAKEPCEQCFALHLAKVRRFVMAKEPIHLLLPSFPAKSPNDKKVF